MLAAAALATVAAALVLLWPVSRPIERENRAPQPPEERAFFSIDRLLEFDGGVLIFGHGADNGEGADVTTYRVTYPRDGQPAHQRTDDETSTAAGAAPVRDAGPAPARIPARVERSRLRVDRNAKDTLRQSERIPETDNVLW